MEAILAYLKAQDDLSPRAGQFGDVREQVSDGEGDPAGKQGQQREFKGPKAKAKGAKGDKGGGRGGDAAQADS